MADETQNIRYLIEIAKQGLGAKEAADELKQVEANAQGAGKSITDMQSAYRQIIALATSSVAIRVISDSISAFQQQAREIVRMEGAMRVAGQYTAAYSAHLQDQANRYEDLFNVQAEATVSTQALLIQFGATSDEVDRLTQLTIDLSAATGQDMTRSANLLTRALSGEFEQFKRLGVELDEGATRGDKFESTIRQLEKRFGGMGGEVAKVNGHLEKFQQNIDAQKKVIGEFWLGATSGPGNFLNRFLQSWNSGTMLENFSVEAFQNGELVRGLKPRNPGNGTGAVDPTRALDPALVKEQLDKLSREQAFQAAGAQFNFFNNTKAGERVSPFGGGYGVSGEGQNAGSNNLETRVGMLQRQRAEQEQVIGSLASAGAMSIEEFEKRREALTLSYTEGLQAIKVANRGAFEEIRIQEMGDYERRRYEVTKYYESVANMVIEYFDAEQAKLDEGSERWYDVMNERDAYLKVLNKNMQRELSDTAQIMKQVGQSFVGNFAGGFSNAFVQMIQGTKDAKEAFSDFASSLLASTAQMIMELLILATIKRALAGTSLGGFLGLAGGGSVVKAASGIGGVAELTRPTYLPSWNVMAAEAGGSEMMTVLSSPKTWSVGGASVISGNVGSSRLAMMAEGDFKNLVPAANGMVAGEASAGGSGGSGTGTGGRVDIRISLDKNLKAEIIDSSIEGAVVRMNNELSQDSQTSRAVKDLTS
jgi:hypothetical protein